MYFPFHALPGRLNDVDIRRRRLTFDVQGRRALLPPQPPPPTHLKSLTRPVFLPHLLLLPRPFSISFP